MAYTGNLTGSEDGVRPVPGATLRWAKTEHRPESIAYRLDPADGSGSLVFTGDTEYCGSVVQLAEGADTLLTECSAPDDAPIPGYLTPYEVGLIASEAGVRRVVLTHVFPQTAGLDLVSRDHGSMEAIPAKRSSIIVRPEKRHIQENTKSAITTTRRR